MSVPQTLVRRAISWQCRSQFGNFRLLSSRSRFGTTYNVSKAVLDLDAADNEFVVPAEKLPLHKRPKESTNPGRHQWAREWVASELAPEGKFEAEAAESLLTLCTSAAKFDSFARAITQTEDGCRWLRQNRSKIVAALDRASRHGKTDQKHPWHIQTMEHIDQIINTTQDEL